MTWTQGVAAVVFRDYRVSPALDRACIAQHLPMDSPRIRTAKVLLEAPGGSAAQSAQLGAAQAKGGGILSPAELLEVERRLLLSEHSPCLDPSPAVAVMASQIGFADGILSYALTAAAVPELAHPSHVQQFTGDRVNLNPPDAPVGAGAVPSVAPGGGGGSGGGGGAAAAAASAAAAAAAAPATAAAAATAATAARIAAP